MPNSTAWVLDFKGGFRAAVGELEMVHLIQSPVLIDIPQTPYYCQRVLIWQDTLLPVMDIGAWLNSSAIPYEQPAAGVFAYQEQPDADIQYGALLLATIPRRQQVNDEQACELPAQPLGWRALAISCFTDAGKAIPILNLHSIFSSALLRA